MWLGYLICKFKKKHDYVFVVAYKATRICDIWISTNGEEIKNQEWLRKELANFPEQKYIITLKCKRCHRRITETDDFMRPHH